MCIYAYSSDELNEKNDSIAAIVTRYRKKKLFS